MNDFVCIASRLGRRPKRRKEVIQDGVTQQLLTPSSSSAAAMLVPGLLASTTATLQLQVNIYFQYLYSPSNARETTKAETNKKE